MDRGDWRSQIIADLIGIPGMDTHILPIRALVMLKRELAMSGEIDAAILFGSVVRGESGKKSDIDIALICRDVEEGSKVQEGIMEILNDIELKNRMKNSFSPIFLQGEEDTHFLWEMAIDGSVIFCRPEFAIGRSSSLEPRSLISYSYDGLDPTVERNLRRFLFENKGGLKIDKEDPGVYISKGVILLKNERSKRFVEFLEDNCVKYTLQKVWY